MKKEKRFETVYQEGGFMGAKTIYVDKETGVNYLFIVSGYAGGLTPLFDAEGKVTPGDFSLLCRRSAGGDIAARFRRLGEKRHKARRRVKAAVGRDGALERGDVVG